MSAFNLHIDAGRASIETPYEWEKTPTEQRKEENRRRSLASLLRTVALMLEQGRDADCIRGHLGTVVGKYALTH